VIRAADLHYYGVPHVLVGEHVMVRVTDPTVECFFKGGRVAAHVRSYRGALELVTHALSLPAQGYLSSFSSPLPLLPVVGGENSNKTYCYAGAQKSSTRAFLALPAL